MTIKNWLSVADQISIDDHLASIDEARNKFRRLADRFEACELPMQAAKLREASEKLDSGYSIVRELSK